MWVFLYNITRLKQAYVSSLGALSDKLEQFEKYNMLITGLIYALLAQYVARSLIITYKKSDLKVVSSVLTRGKYFAL